MESTLSGPVPLYIGADLTDRYSAQCRDIDVCGLTPAGGVRLRLAHHERLQATSWHWRWDLCARGASQPRPRWLVAPARCPSNSHVPG